VITDGEILVCRNEHGEAADEGMRGIVGGSIKR